MNCKRSLFLHLLALMTNGSSAFAPIRTPMTPAAKSNIPAPVFKSPELPTLGGPSSTSLSMGSSDLDLVVGFVTIAAACTPYVLGTIFPTFFNDGFFLPVYNADESGRVAEIGWKVRYATLGLALTTLTFLEVYYGDKEAVGVLRDSYILWAIFYTEATRKIRSEARADPPILANPSGRLGIQLWHSLVTIVLWADVSESYTGQAITNFLKDVFT